MASVPAAVEEHIALAGDHCTLILDWRHVTVIELLPLAGGDVPECWCVYLQ